MKKPIKTFIYKALNDHVVHYGSTNSLPLIIEGEHIHYNGNEVLPQELERAIENDHSKYSIIRNWNKFWKAIDISKFVNENTD